MARFVATFAGAALLFSAQTETARAQQSITVLDENDLAEADYREASHGTVTAPDSLLLRNGTKLPITTAHAFSGESSGLLQYRHTDGTWQMAVRPIGGSSFDVSRFDSLIVWVNGPDSLAGSELPRIMLEDAQGGLSAASWLSILDDVRVDPEGTGFTEFSESDVVLEVSYIDALPSTSRRPGYPGALSIVFADEPQDTSLAGIGVPAVPAHFIIETESGLRADFRFRDLDGDGTLSSTNEYIDVLLPESYESSKLAATWRIRPTEASGFINPPGQGDVFRLEVEFDEFTLDGDPETWQRISLPLDDLKAGDFDRKTTVGAVFQHGAPNETTRTLWFDLLTIVQNDDEAFLDMVQQKTFDFFWMEANPSNGLVRDRTGQNYASIAAVGFGLSAMTVGIDRGWITYEQGRQRVLNTLEFFWTAEQSAAPNATGYKGFFYHFLDMNTGRRSGTNELSTIDTALLLGGVLHVREYFVDDDEIRSLADSIYHRVDWTWMQYRNPNNPTAAISHGWFPDPEGRANADPSTGFIVHDWLGYNEAMILYILALGSPTHPVGPEAWDAWASGYGGQWQTHYGYTYLVFPPLFGHQYSHVWIDFRGIQDAFMEEKGIDYFENSRRATLAQRAYHIANPGGYPNYSKDEWGLTASDTPDGYSARGAPPPQNDDGTIAPTAPGGSIAFAPDESIAALRTMHRKYPALWGPYGFRDAYNVDRNWFAQTYLGIDQGPILLMIENHRTEAIWEVAMRNESIRRGLERAGFTGVGVAVDDPVEVARTDVLAVFPNPTADRARVNYVLDAPSSVRLVLYDVLGRELTVLEDATRPAGEHQLDMDLTMRPSGLYLLVFEMGDRRTTRVLTKIE